MEYDHSRSYQTTRGNFKQRKGKLSTLLFEIHIMNDTKNVKPLFIDPVYKPQASYYTRVS